MSNNFVLPYRIISLFFILISTLPAQTIIKDIKFNGLEGTKEHYLRNFLNISIGDELDTNLLKEEELFLRNSQYFSSADFSIGKDKESGIVNFNVKEKRTLLPIVSFNIIKSNYFLQLGAIEYNLFGTGNVLGGYYQYYDRSSFNIFGEFKNISGSRFGISGRYRKSSTTEPAYFVNGKTFFDVDINSLELIFSYELSKYLLRNPKTFFNVGFNYLDEQYLKNYEKSGQGSPGVDKDLRNKIILKANFSYSDIDYFYEYLDGFALNSYYDLVSEKDDMFGFFQLLNEVKFYKRFYSMFNVAARFRFGISTNKFSPFIPFLIDNYTNVRGAGDRVFRGSAEMSFNLELRSSLYRNSWTALQLVNYFDYGSLRPGGKQLKTIFNKENIFSSIGLGLRTHLLNFYNVIFRFDFGVQLKKNTNDYFIFGLGHYF